MQLLPLQSGSAGNCIHVEGNGVRLLFDAGISGAKAERRLAEHGYGLHGVDAVIISHDHSDHVGGAGVLARRFGLPVHITEPTWHASRLAERADVSGDDGSWRHFASGATLRFESLLGALTVETIRTPHDAADGVIFVIDDGEHRVGIMTDFGHVFPGLGSIVETLDAVYLESNYDAGMLADGDYPAFLKRRISGPGGHISNDESAELIARHGKKLRWACLAHLSANTNTPEVALATHRARYGDGLPLTVASRSSASARLDVG